MNLRLARRAALLGLIVVVVLAVASFVVALATSSDVRVPGATTTVDEAPDRPLSVEFLIDPLPALAMWAAATAVAFLVLGVAARHRRPR